LGDAALGDAAFLGVDLEELPDERSILASSFVDISLDLEEEDLNKLSKFGILDLEEEDLNKLSKFGILSIGELIYYI